MDILHNILECVSTTLKSLTLEVPYFVERFMNFGRLPRLQYLILDVGLHDFVFLNPENITFNPETLPMLKSVEVPLGLILSDKVRNEEELILDDEMDAPVKFTNVKTLTLRLRHNYFVRYDSGVGLNRRLWALKHLLKVFPNITKLSFKNESIRRIEQQDVKHVLLSLIQSPLSQNINEICIDGFEEDIMGQVLGHINTLPEGQGQVPVVDSPQGVDVRAGSSNSFFLTNVRKIRLGLSAVAVTHFTPLSHLFFSVPNLTAMAKYFPVLQIIEISELLFRGVLDEERNELIETLATTFPYLWVHVINESE